MGNPLQWLHPMLIKGNYDIHLQEIEYFCEFESAGNAQWHYY